MKPTIPERNRDLRRYVRWHRFLRLAGYLLWLGIFLLGALSYNNAHQTYPPERLMIGWRLLLWMLIGAASGFFLFRIGQMLTDRSFEGTIVRAKLSRGYTSSKDPGSMSYDFRLHLRLLVRTADGKKRRIRIEQKPGFYIYYYEGSRICHYAGLPYPISNPENHPMPPSREGQTKPPDDLSGGYLCAACGSLNGSLAGGCSDCRHSLIDPKDIWGE